MLPATYTSETGMVLRIASSSEEVPRECWSRGASRSSGNFIWPMTRTFRLVCRKSMVARPMGPAPITSTSSSGASRVARLRNTSTRRAMTDGARKAISFTTSGVTAPSAVNSFTAATAVATAPTETAVIAASSSRARSCDHGL